MQRYCTAIVVAALVWVSACGAFAQSAWERPDDPFLRVGFVVTVDDERAAELERRIRQEVAERGGVFVARTPVDSAGDSSSDMLELREEAEEAFFFGGPAQAQKLLIDALDGRLEATRGWMARPAETRALFESGIFLVRAYLEEGDEESADRWLRRLIAAFPAHRPDERTVPPAVIERWRRLREETTDTELAVEPAGDGCEGRINGASAGEEPPEVVDDRLYLWSVDCPEDDHSGTWWVRSGGADGVASSVQSSEPRLDRMLERRDLRAVVYVGGDDCGGDDDALCIGVRRRGGKGGSVLQPLVADDLQEWVERVVP